MSSHDGLPSCDVILSYDGMPSYDDMPSCDAMSQLFKITEMDVLYKRSHIINDFLSYDDFPTYRI